MGPANAQEDRKKHRTPSEEKPSWTWSSRLVCFGSQLLRVVCTNCLTDWKSRLTYIGYPKPWQQKQQNVWSSRWTDQITLLGNYNCYKCKIVLIKEGMWNIVTGNENFSENQGEQTKYLLRRDCAIRGSNAVVLAWTRLWKSNCSLEAVGRSIPGEDMGEQIGPTKKNVQFEAERWTINAETC